MTINKKMRRKRQLRKIHSTVVGFFRWFFITAVVIWASVFIVVVLFGTWAQHDGAFDFAKHVVYTSWLPLLKYWMGLCVVLQLLGWIVRPMWTGLRVDRRRRERARRLAATGGETDQ